MANIAKFPFWSLSKPCTSCWHSCCDKSPAPFMVNFCYFSAKPKRDVFGFQFPTLAFRLWMIPRWCRANQGKSSCFRFIVGEGFNQSFLVRAVRLALDAQKTMLIMPLHRTSPAFLASHLWPQPPAHVGVLLQRRSRRHWHRTFWIPYSTGLRRSRIDADQEKKAKVLFCSKKDLPNFSFGQQFPYIKNCHFHEGVPVQTCWHAVNWFLV